MIAKLTLNKDPLIEKAYDEGMQMLEDFFEFKWNTNRPYVFIINDRKTIDEILGRKTEPWVVGWTNKDDVFLLDRENFEKESNHIYSDNYYETLVKHELSHLFYEKVGQGFDLPIWLNEGLSIFTSGQLGSKNKPVKFAEFLDFFSKHKKDGKTVYKETGFVVEWLVNKYGKEKLLELIKRTKDYPTEEKFNKLFEEIYKFELSYDNFIL